MTRANRELFGVFGGLDAFGRHADPGEFDRVLEGDAVTVGVRDDTLDRPTRTDVHGDDVGCCVVWGEVHTPSDGGDAARWLSDRYATDGRAALSGLNGSYLAVVERDGEALVATDVLRTRECFHADTRTGRAFGSDPVRVASAHGSPTVDPRGVLQFLYLGVVLGARTPLRELSRVRTDAVLTRDDVEPLDRLQYDPREFDYASALAERLDCALGRRVTDRDRTGLLLGAGYDSRAILAAHPGIGVCYTVGTSASPEVRGAERLAAQYDTAHVRLEPDDSYLVPSTPEVVASQGLRETIHIHHGGHEHDMDVDEMFHGMLFDTLFRDHFLPTAAVEVGDLTVPFPWLDSDPELVPAYKESLAFTDPGVNFVERCDAVDTDDPDTFLRRALERELSHCYERCDRQLNAFTQLGIRTRPTMPFRSHLADRFHERFVAADTALVEWHLRTPPEHRTTETFLRAVRSLDDGLLRHRPPDRPFDSPWLNEVASFLERSLPGDAYRSPWPDRVRLYETNDLDRKLLAESPGLHDAPIRFKLRLNDLSAWLEHLRTRCPTDVSTDSVPSSVLVR